MKISSTRFVLAVPKLDVSVAYYQDKLGMKLDFEAPGWRFLSRDAFSIMLGECPDALSATEIGDHSYFAYANVELIDDLYDELSSRDVVFIKKITNEPWGMREFGLKTIDGHRVMFGQEIN